MKGWEGVGEYDVQDTGCPSEHYVIVSSASIKEGDYYVEVNLKDDGDADDNVSEDVTVIINVPGQSEILKKHVALASELDIGKVAKIEVRYENGKPKVDVFADPSIPPVSHIYIGEGRGCGSVNGPEDIYNCGCMPCDYRIIPYLQQALAGPLSGAGIGLYIASEYTEKTPLYLTNASVGHALSSAEIISIPKEFTNALNDNELYIVEARGGIDIDSDDNFEIDDFETINRGSLHTVIDGKTLKEFGYKLNVLTEIAYQNVKDDIGVLSNEKIVDKLNEISTLLMNGKIDPDSDLDLAYEDLLGWLPTFDKKLLFYDYDKRVEPIVQKIYKDENISFLSYDIVYGKSVLPRIKSQNYVIDENTLINTLLGEIEILDEGSSPIQTIHLSGTGSENFIVNASGEIRISSSASFDFETTKAYYLQIIAENIQGISTSNFSVLIRDILDAPSIVTFEGGSIFSNAIPQSYIAHLGFNEGTSPVTEMVLEGNGHQYFDIDSDGNIVVSALGLNEIVSTTSFPLSVKAKNSSGFSSPVEITLYVQKVNNVPSLKKFTGHIDENENGSTLVGKVEFDSGSSAVNAFVLTGAGSENFIINLSGEIFLKEGVLIDYESVQSYNLLLSARNEDGTSLSSSVDIIVNDLEDVPVIGTELEFNIQENIQSGTLIGNILQSPGLSVVENISLSNDNFRADVQGNIYLKESKQLDYETQTEYSVSAIATNSYGDSISKKIRIIVHDVVDVPVLTSLITNVLEGSPEGTIVGSISFTQGTSPITSMQFTQTNNLFSIDLDGVIRIKENAILDYEQTSNYVLYVFATNDSGDSENISVSISIGNVLDAPELKDFEYVLEENTKTGTLPFNLVANEGLSPISNIKIYDINGSESKTLASDVNGQVDVLPTADLNYERLKTYSFHAIAYNEEGPSKAAVIELSLINVLDAPELEAFVGYVDENASIGTIVGQLNYNEGLSPVSSMRLTSLDSSLDIPFSIDENGKIQVKIPLDYETISSYDLRAKASNEQGVSSEVKVEIKLNDVLDSPVLQNLTGHIQEDMDPLEIVGQIVYEEGLNTITKMVLSGEDSESFTVDKDGIIRLKETMQLDYETKNSYSFFAQAFSASDNSNIIDVNILVDDVEEKARAGVGLWADANVNIYKLEDNGSQILLFTERTSLLGSYEDTARFNSHRLELDKDSFYLYELSGGSEYDMDKDGVIDSTPTMNLGTLHAIVKGEWVRHLDEEMSVNLLSDVFYQWNQEELKDGNVVRIENNLVTAYNPISYLTGIQSLTYSPLSQLNQWKYHEFSTSDLDYMANFLYENSSKYTLFINNSFYNDYYDSLPKRNIFIENKMYLYDVNDYQGIRLFEIGKSVSKALSSFSKNSSEIEMTQDEKYLVANQSLGEGVDELVLFDINNPLDLVKIGSISTYVSGVKFSPSGNVLYARSGYADSTLEVIDTSNKSLPIDTGHRIITNGGIKDIDFSNDTNLMYIADAKAGLQIIDVNTKEVIGNYMTDGLVNTVKISSDNTKAIISVNADDNSSIQVIDISDRTHPVIFQKFLMSDSISTFSESSSGIDLYTADAGVHIYENINAEYSQVLEKSYVISSKLFGFSSLIEDIYILDDGLKMLVITQTQSLLFDISDKTNPIFLEEIELASPGS